MRTTKLGLVALAALAVSILVSACATTTPPTATGEEVGRSSHVVVATVRPGDTAAEIARRYLNDPALASRVVPLSGGALHAGGLAAVALTPADAALAGSAKYVPILCYHRFNAARSTSRMEVSGAEFEKQLQWLRDNGWTVVPLKAVISFVEGRDTLPPKSIAITFDDGYRSAYEVAAPLLRRYGDPATFFIYTDFVGTGAGMSWTQVADLKRDGLLEVQSHSKSHGDMAKHLPGETPGAYAKRLQAEVYTPLAVLGRHGASGTEVFAYPYGSANEQVEGVVHGAGYPAGVTVARGGNPSWAAPLLLRRDMIFGDDSLATFAQRVQSAAAGGSGGTESEGER